MKIVLSAACMVFCVASLSFQATGQEKVAVKDGLNAADSNLRTSASKVESDVRSKDVQRFLPKM